MSMMELWSGLEKPFENFINFHHIQYLKNKIWARVTDYDNLNSISLCCLLDCIGKVVNDIDFNVA